MRLSLSGPIGSGKTTLSERLVKEQGYVRGSFAGVLKEELARILEIDPDEFVTNKEEWRWALQAWGAMRRQVNSDYWIDAVRYWLLNQGEDVVFDDTRFPNELEMLGTEEHFYLIKLDCPKEDSIDYQIQKGKTLEEATASANDVTERALDNYTVWDAVIPAPRSRSIDDIYSDIKLLIQ